MKKFILFLFAALIVSVSLNAQSGRSYEFPVGLYATEALPFTAADTATNAAPWSFTIIPNKGNTLWYTFAVKITEVSATTSTVIQLQHKKFAYQAWANLGSAITYHGTGSDTTALITEESTKTFARYLRILVTPANGKVKTTFILPSFKQ
jgi:hypothetical protein